MTEIVVALILTLNGSIIENIAFAENPSDVDMNRVKEAIKFSKLEKLVNDKRNGFDFTSYGSR